MYDQELSHIINAAVSRIHPKMEQAAPFLAQQVSNWMTDLCDGKPEAYFKHPLGFPMLLFPWWLEKTLHHNPDTAFQTDLVYSTVNGYFYIRLIDNLMDGHASVELQLLPAGRSRRHVDLGDPLVDPRVERRPLTDQLRRRDSAWAASLAAPESGYFVMTFSYSLRTDSGMAWRLTP